MKKIAVFTVLFLLATPLSWAIGEKPSAPSSGVVDAGNQFCPVSGDKVSGKDFVEYDGKRYGLCCKMCANKFRKNPDKYLAQLAEIESGKVPAGSGHHEHMH